MIQEDYKLIVNDEKKKCYLKHFSPVVYFLAENKIKVTVLHKTFLGWEIPLYLIINDLETIFIGSSNEPILKKTCSIKTRVTKQSFSKKILYPQQFIQCIHYNERSFQYLLEFHPHFSYYYFDKLQCLYFLKKYFPDNVISLFLSLTDDSYKSFLFGLCVLYVYGGYYVSSDLYCKSSIKTIIEENDPYFMVSSKNDPKLKKKLDTYIYELSTKKSISLKFQNNHLFWWDCPEFIQPQNYFYQVFQPIQNLYLVHKNKTKDPVYINYNEQDQTITMNEDDSILEVFDLRHNQHFDAFYQNTICYPTHQKWKKCNHIQYRIKNSFNNDFCIQFYQSENKKYIKIKVCHDKNCPWYQNISILIPPDITINIGNSYIGMKIIFLETCLLEKMII